MRFYDVDGGPNRQVLISNCKTKFGQENSPSIAIELDKANNNVVFTALVKVDLGATLALAYQVNFDIAKSMVATDDPK